MDRIVVGPGGEGLGEMLADLIRGNIARDPERERLLDEPGRVNVRVTDADIEIGMRFEDGLLAIGEPVPDPDLSFACEADVLMALTAVPLRFGMPDQMTKEGRTVAGWLVNGTLNVKGLPRHLPLMIRLNRLFTVR